MISSQIIKKSIEDLHTITKIDFTVYDMEAIVVASTCEQQVDTESVLLFSQSLADSQQVKDYHYFKVNDEDTPSYILVARGSGDDVHTMGRVAVSSLQELIIAYKDRFDSNTFIQNLVLDNLLLVDIYNRAKKLHIETEATRLVYVIETKNEKDNTAMEIMKSLFGGKDFITAVDEKSLILIQQLDDPKDEEKPMQTARMIIDMLNAEAMSTVRVAFGTIVGDIQQVSRSYKEARMALNVGKTFYAERRIYSYAHLGIGRLIYQLPLNLCEMFIEETFIQDPIESIDEETLTTINKFFENNLNVSETARQLFVHRNTLVYRLEKLQKSMGLDIRNFEDALTFKIALMVTNYMNYLKKELN